MVWIDKNLFASSMRENLNNMNTETRPFSLAGTAIRYDDSYKDHGNITSKVRFVIMEKFLKKAVEKIDWFFRKKDFIPHEIKISFFAANDGSGGETGLNFKRLDSENASPILGNIDGARVQFHFVQTYTPVTNNAAQRERSRKFKEYFPELSEAIETAFHEVSEDSL